MSLARAESRRLFKRRFTKLLMVGVLLILAAVAAGTYLSNQKVSAGQIAEAKAEANRDYQAGLVSAEQEKQKCLAAEGTPEIQNWGGSCENIYTPSPEDYDYVWYMPASFELRQEFPDMISVFAVVLAAAAFLIGASFVGSEWNSGGMMNLLLWRPQRLRVLGTKMAVFLGWLTGVSLLLAAVWTGVFQLIAQFRGTTDRMTSGVWQSFGLMGLRGLALIVVAGALGFAMASLGRHTGMALGALIGIGAVQIGVYVMAQLAGAKYPDVFLAPLWLFAWLYKEFVVEDYTSCDYSSTGGCELDQFTMTWQVAGTGTAVLVVLVVGAAMWTMRSRDIT
ncbi:ABC transporter permease subunit [Actinoplanes aureus]|uniref:ABC transporter permease subunit n=1 Tax=Actinoplanes aureus TaxID=2792083 RepID=A0A931CGI2_9ACTN|nr:ABC transporter permease subunit [Actinoplanes aureus]MBG0566796.1 ABC transporter permease subunit [Actinoplanes aureus]